MGFPTPIRQWLRDARAEPLYTAIQDRQAFLASFLNLKELDSLITRHRSGLEDATDRIWRLINLQLWGDLFLTGKRERWWDGILPAAVAEPEVLPTPV
jgi:asparagine synthase (glutamine-hydrolysing)